jgi:hypothetical protein
MSVAVNNFKKCLNMKCKNEEEQFKKNKYSIEIEKLKQDLKDGKIDLIKFNNVVAKLKIIIIDKYPLFAQTTLHQLYFASHHLCRYV